MLATFREVTISRSSHVALLLHLVAKREVVNKVVCMHVFGLFFVVNVDDNEKICLSLREKSRKAQFNKPSSAGLRLVFGFVGYPAQTSLTYEIWKQACSEQCLQSAVMYSHLH